MLKNYIAQNRPPLVLVRSSELMWHYVVAVGYGEDFISIADPASGEIWDMPMDDFMGAWAFTQNMHGDKMENELIVKALESGDVYNFTMIVPRESHK